MWSEWDTRHLNGQFFIHLRLDEDVCVGGAPPEVSLLDLAGDGGAADAVGALRPRALGVELLPPVVVDAGPLNVRLAVQKALLDNLHHHVSLLVWLEKEDDLDLGPILPFDRVDGDGDVRHGGHGGDVPVVSLECLLLHHPEAGPVSEQQQSRGVLTSGAGATLVSPRLGGVAGGCQIWLVDNNFVKFI